MDDRIEPKRRNPAQTRSRIERNEFTRWDTLNWNVSLQYAPALVKPMGETAFGLVGNFAVHAPRRHARARPCAARAQGRNDDLMPSVLLARARCTWDELKEKRYVEYPLELPAPWVDRLLERAGGWDLVPSYLADQWHQFRAEDEANLGKPKPLVYSSRRQRRKFNGQVSFLGEIADCLIHPETAAEHGIADGQKVRVFNKAGEILVTAKIDATMRRGVCSIPHGHRDANINNLTCTYDRTRSAAWRTTARFR